LEIFDSGVVKMSDTQKFKLVKVPDRLDASNVKDFKQDALSSMESSEQGIIIDFNDTTFLDSAGLGSLVSILKTAAQNGQKKIALTNLGKQVKQIFELTRLYRLFDIYESVDKAEQEFKD
jgi:anti-sigma B factor antagonist